MPSFDIVSEVNQVEVQQRARPGQQGGRARASTSRARTRASSYDEQGADAVRRRRLQAEAGHRHRHRASSPSVGSTCARSKYGDAEKISGNKVKQAVTRAHRRRAGARQEDREAGEGQQLKVQALDPGRRRARVWHEEGRPAGRDRAGEEVDHRLSAAVPEFPRLARSAGALQPPSDASEASARRSGSPTLGLVIRSVDTIATVTPALKPATIPAASTRSARNGRLTSSCRSRGRGSSAID